MIQKWLIKGDHPRLLSMDEYEIQGIEYTKLSLAKLREELSIANAAELCGILRKVRHADKLADFVCNGNHVTFSYEDELEDYFGDISEN
ncbi:hypothetical protein ACOME3_004341 [Neoechinorhynchus agilis]